MSEKEREAAERLGKILNQLTDEQRDLFLARGEGFRDGYALGRRDAEREAARKEERA